MELRNKNNWTTRILLFLLIGAGPASASGPAPLGEEGTVISPATELAVALTLRDSFTAQPAVVVDGELVEVLQRVGRRVAQHSDRPDLPYAFFVIDSGDGVASYQAVSLPGGTIALTRDLAELLADDEDQLAFALAHEIAHVALRHHLSGAELLRDEGLAAIDYAERLHRHHELESDRYGALYLVRAGLRFTASAEALHRIEAVAGGWHPERRHPTYARRIESLEAFRPELERSVDAFDRAGELIRDGRVDDALEALSIFVQQFPRSVAGRVDLGVACLAKLAQVNGTPAGLDEPLPFLVESGIEVRGVYDGEWLERARYSFAQALAVQPTNAEALLGLALVALREGETQASLGYLERAFVVTDDVRLLVARGNARYLDGRPDLAIDDYQQALESRKDWPVARKNLALAYESIGRNERAAETWRELLDEPLFADRARWQLALLERREP